MTFRPPGPPFRADHVGSLLRPQNVKASRAQWERGEISAAELRSQEDRAVRDLVQMQEEVGLQAATDGEVRRSAWQMDFIYQIGGIAKSEDELRIRFHNQSGDIEFTPAALRVTEKISLDHTIFADDFRAVQQAVTTATPKLTIPSPSMVHYRGGRAAIDEAVYPDLDEFWADLADAYRQEVHELAAAGCTYLQFDDTSLAYLNDPRQREHVASIGGDPDRQHETYIANLNRALADRPSGMVVTTHLCRGNHASSWVAEGGYDFVAEALFTELQVDGYFLEYDDERSGGFEPLRFVPKGKAVVLGLVTSKHGALESRDELKRRIDEASQFVDIDQLCLSPQCGFSSTLVGNDLTYEQQRAKLRLVVEVAEEVWGSG
jgi:methionine synthase II (cobalamin-independent)